MTARARLELDIQGSCAEGFIASNINCDNQGLRTCFACSGENVRVANELWPHYWVECRDCGAQGPAGYPAQPHEGLIDSVPLCRRLHQQAFDNAVDGWNRCAPRRLIE